MSVQSRRKARTLVMDRADARLRDLVGEAHTSFVTGNGVGWRTADGLVGYSTRTVR